MSHQYIDTLTGGITNIENQSAIQSILDTQVIQDANTVQVEEDDIFQCGKCKKQFTSLNSFCSHKQERCVGLPAPRPIIHNNTILQGLSAFQTIGLQNGVRSGLSQAAYGSHGSLPQLTQNVMLADDQVISFADLTQTGLMQGSTIHLAPAGSTVQSGGPFLSQLGQRPTNVTFLQSAIQPTTSLCASSGSAFSTPVSMGNLHALVQPQQQITIATALPEQKTQQIQIVKPTPSRPGKKANKGILSSDQQALQEEAKKQLSCTYCSKIFKKKFDLQQHVRSHTGEKPFQCVVCGRAFAQKSNVKKHMSTHKVWPTGPGSTLPNQPPPILVPVSEEDGTSEQAEEQTQVVEISQTSQASDDNAIIVTDAKGDNKQYKGGKQNFKVKVVIDNSFMCQYCPEKFKTYLQLKSHMVNHKNIQVYRCVKKECSATFKNMEAFLEHVESHNDELTYRCHQCNEVFNTLYELGTHQYSHSFFDNPGKTGPKHYQCTLCFNKYASPEALSNHLATETHNHVCPHCGKKCASERFLRKHLITHGTENLHQCPTCKKCFKTDHYLRTHTLIHTGLKPWSCDQCMASFNRKDKLKRHLLIHEKKCKYKCPFKALCGCTKEFNRPDKLKAHLYSHSLTKPWTCKICAREFKRKPQYNEHMRGHRGEYAFKCEKCNRGFFRMKLLKEHKCDPDKPVSRQMFRTRRVKRKPGRPRKIVKVEQTDGENVVEEGNGGENNATTVKENVRSYVDQLVRGRRGILKKSHKTIMKAKQLKLMKNEKTKQINSRSSVETISGATKKNDGLFDGQNTLSIKDKEIHGTEHMTIATSQGNYIILQSVPGTDIQKPKRNKSECFVKTPPANIVPMSLVEQYITVQLTTTNGCDGSEIQAQLIPTADFNGQFQFHHSLPSGHFEIQRGAFHPIQIVDGQPMTLTVNEGDQLGKINVSQHDVIDIPVDIVTVSSDQTLVCNTEVNVRDDNINSEQGYENTEQVYDANSEQAYETIGDYDTEETVLQGSENLINSNVEILVPETENM